MQNTRKLGEVRQEVAQQTTRSPCCGAQWMASRSRSRPCAPKARPTKLDVDLQGRDGARSLAMWRHTGAYTLHAPQPDHSQDRAALLVWPKNTVTDHHKALRSRILAEYRIEQVAPKFPKAANRYSVTFPTRAGAVAPDWMLAAQAAYLKESTTPMRRRWCGRHGSVDPSL